MKDIVRVEKGSDLYALFVPAKLPVDGVNFVTRQTDDFQVGIMERPAGYKVKPHTHPPREQTISTVTEFLQVAEGKIRVTVFDEEWKELATEELSTGDFLIFFKGGHSVEMLEKSRLIEVKQGPYPGDNAAKSFKGDSA
jgi:quercetin dioxygenase-like cupin family protein